MHFFKLIIYGLIIGIGFIIPGVSGGSLAVILGIYDQIIFMINNINKHPKKSIAFLSLLGLGVLLGVFVFGKLILFLLKTKETQTKFVFIGLIIGSIPGFFKNIKKDNIRLNKYLIILAILISFFLLLIERLGLGLNIEKRLIIGSVPFVELFIAGILYAAGKVIPGISGAALLMLVGMYNYLLNIVANPLQLNSKNLIILIPFITGSFIGVIVLLKLINYLLTNYYIKTYSIILGFAIGSIFFLLPDKSFDVFVCALLTIPSFLISCFLTKKEAKYTF